MTESIARTTHKAEHDMIVNAPARHVYDLIADVARWPHMMAPTVHGVRAEVEGDTELIRMFSMVNGATKIWMSRRRHDLGALTVTFHPQKTPPAVGGMNGAWVAEPVTDATCRVHLLHEFFPATDDPADLDWIIKTLDTNGPRDLRAVKTAVEAIETGALFTVADTVEVAGGAEDVYAFLYGTGWLAEEASLEEPTPGMQVLRTGTTTTVRVGEPHRRIVHKRFDPPAPVGLHTGRWLIEESGTGRVSVTAEQTVRIDAEGADLAAAKDSVREALSAESAAALARVKARF
jgi:aromatase